MTAVVPSDASTAAPNLAIRFHISLNVADLERSVAFFRAISGREPAKHRPDYAKFEFDDPPLVLSLEPNASAPGGSLNHLGFRMPDSAALVDVHRRLELAGITTRREEGVECCYARQTKFWVHDPDGNLWEFYTLDEDLDHRGDERLALAAPSAGNAERAKSIWVHRLGDRFPARLPILDGTVDCVQLQGTLNERLTAEELARRLSETRRILRSDGIVHLHMLTSDRALGEQPISLPGMASRVEAVPECSEVCAALIDAGFVDAQVVFKAHSPCFRVGECELRETRIEAKAP